MIQRKIKNAIFSFSLKKALESDKMLFLILQKSYYSISYLFYMIFSELIKNEYHLQCWKESIDAILKKLNKIDYLQSKSCRIIDWFIYLFAVLTSNMSAPCGSIYWCLYRKTLRGKKTHIFRPSSIAFRNSFEALSTRINLMSFFIRYSVISWYVSLIITVWLKMKMFVS